MAKQIASLRRITPPLPRGLSVQQRENQLVIKKRWFSGRALVFLTISIAIGVASFGLWEMLSSLAEDEAQSDTFIFAVGCTLLSAVLLYLSLREFLNSTVITVTAAQISLRHGPLPLRKGKSIKVNDIAFLFHRKRSRHLWWRFIVGRGTVLAAFVMGIHYYELIARLRTGRPVVLLSDIRSVNQIVPIRGSIASFLGLDE